MLQDDSTFSDALSPEPRLPAQLLDKFIFFKPPSLPPPQIQQPCDFSPLLAVSCLTELISITTHEAKCKILNMPLHM